MYARTGYLIQTADYPGDSLDPYQLTHFYRVAEAVTASGLAVTNKYGAYGSSVAIPFLHASDNYVAALRGFLNGLDGPNRAFYLEFDGLKNPAKENFFMVRSSPGQITVSRSYVGVLAAAFGFRTEAWL